MKKSIFILLVMCLFASQVVVGNASQDIENKTENVIILYDKETNRYLDFINNGNSISVYSDGELIYFTPITYEDVYTHDSDEWRMYNSVARAGYETWGASYVEYRRGQINLPSSDVDGVSAIIAGLLLSGCGILGVAASAMIGLAGQFRDRSLNKAYFIQKANFNTSCTILAKTFSQYYTNSDYTGFVGVSPTGHMWLDSPWLYIYPAACRDLVNTYP